MTTLFPRGDVRCCVVCLVAGRQKSGRPGVEQLGAVRRGRCGAGQDRDDSDVERPRTKGQPKPSILLMAFAQFSQGSAGDYRKHQEQSIGPLNYQPPK